MWVKNGLSTTLRDVTTTTTADVHWVKSGHRKSPPEWLSVSGRALVPIADMVESKGYNCLVPKADSCTVFARDNHAAKYENKS
jgi:hypothetical protein